MGDLLENNHQTDAGEHALEHGTGDIVGDRTKAERAEGELKAAGEDDGGLEGGEVAEVLNGTGDQHGKARSGTADTDFRPGERGHDGAPDDPGQDAGKQRRATGQRDSKTKGKGDEEDN